MSTISVPHTAVIVKDASVADRWADHKRMAAAVALQLVAAGFHSRGERMSVCSDVVTYRYCPACDTWHVDRANLCRDRLCPICNWRLSLQRYAMMQDVVRPMIASGLTWCLVTLTVQNCAPAALSRTIDAIMRCWHRALSRRDMRASVGWARGLELTYNAEEGTLHPHMHVLCAWPPATDRGESLKRAWVDLVAAEGLVVSIKAQHSAALDGPSSADLTKDILETYKYSIKGSDVLHMPVGVLREVARQWGGRRLMALGGVLKTAAAERALEEVAEAAPVSVCRSCGSAELDRYLLRWSMGEQVYKLVQLHTQYPDLYPLGDAYASPDMLPDAYASGSQRPPDVPVMLNTVNGRILVYPGGQYQVIDPIQPK